MSNINVTYYFADWCGYCKLFRGEWDRFKTMAGNYDIKCCEMEDKDINKLKKPVIVGGKKLRGYPSIKIEYLRNNKTINLEYSGERNADALLAFVKRQSMR